MAASASARLHRRTGGRHELPASGSTTGENHEPEDAHTIVRGTAFLCRNQGAILNYSVFGALQRNMMPRELFFLPSLVFSRFDLMSFASFE
jgi:hypothetical protein